MSILKAIGGIVLLLAASCLLDGVEVRLRESSSPRCGDPLRFAITGGEPDWAVTDVERTPRLELTGPGGGQVQRPAFLLADGALEVRHVARSPGRHHWLLLSPRGAELARGSFEVAPGAGPQGPLRPMRSNPRLLAFSDGTPFIGIGPNLCWTAGRDPVAEYEAAFARLAEHGGNHTRIWMCSWSLGIEGPQPDALNLRRAEQLDGVLAAARRHGIRVTLVLDNHTDILSGRPFPYGEGEEERRARFFAVPLDPQWQRRVRYCLARWGCDDALLAWELCNEPDMAQMIRERCLPWVEAGLAFLARHDLDHRLRTVSWAGADWDRAMRLPDVDLVQIHKYVLEFDRQADVMLKYSTQDGVGMLAVEMARTVPLGKPVSLAETGYQGTNEDNGGHELDAQGLLLRQQAWAGLLLGGYTTAMNWWWDVYLDRRQLWGVYRPIAAAVREIDWRDPGLVPVAPNQDGPVRVMGWQSARQVLLWPQAMPDTWHRALIGREPRRGLLQPLTLRLPGMQPGSAFRVRGLDAASGAWEELPGIVSDAQGELPLRVPAGRPDLILLVVRR